MISNHHITRTWFFSHLLAHLVLMHLVRVGGTSLSLMKLSQAESCQDLTAYTCLLGVSPPPLTPAVISLGPDQWVGGRRGRVESRTVYLIPLRPSRLYTCESRRKSQTVHILLFSDFLTSRSSWESWLVLLSWEVSHLLCVPGEASGIHGA